MGKRTLILGWPLLKPQDWLKKYPDIRVDRIYREDLNYWPKRLENISFHTPRILQHGKLAPNTYFGAWKEHVAEFDTIIIIDEIRGPEIFEYILERNNHCRVCVFYDSPIKRGSRKDPTQYEKFPVSFYTCDRKIANDYGIKFKPYFYIFSPYDYREIKMLPVVDVKQDIFFVGEEKGNRLQELKRIIEIIDKAGLTYKICLVPQKQKKYTDEEKKYLSSKMTYSNVIKNIRESRAILELVSNGQTGITQRPYEALFFQKKLITTSNEVKSYDNDDNFFVLGERNIEELPFFLVKKSKVIDKEIIQEYTIKAWIKNIERS